MGWQQEGYTWFGYNDGYYDEEEKDPWADEVVSD